MILEIQILAWDRHQDVAGFNQLKSSQPCVCVITFSDTFHQDSDLLNLQIYVRKQIDVQTLINVQSSNSCPISMSHTSVLFQIIKLVSNSQSYGRFSLSQIDVTDLCPYPNPNQ